MKNIIFIHGMFQNPKSWDNWVNYFTKKGYNCIAPAWPYHEGEPTELRRNPDPQLGELELETIIDKFEGIALQTEDPIFIGHSVGGLIVQILINRGYGKAGVCIDSVAPNGMLSFDWGFFKNSILIVNPFKDDHPFYTDPQSFHESFCNTMTMEETQQAFDAYATHDSRNVLRDCMGEAGRIDFDLPHAPLLFIGGEEDKIIPAELNEKNSDAYTDPKSLTYFEKFPNRGHFICGQPGWEEVAESVADWLEREEVIENSVSSNDND